MVAVRGGLGCEVSIVTSHKSLGVFLVPFSTRILSELKMVAYFSLKLWSNWNHAVFQLKGGWRFLGSYMCALVRMLMVTLVEVDVQKFLVE